MKNKKNIIYVIITLLIIGASSSITYILCNKKIKTSNIENNIITDDQYVGLEPYEIANERIYSEEISNFSVAIGGSDIIINNDFLKKNNIPIYKFEAGIVYKIVLVTEQFVGVKLNDVLKALSITNYNAIEFIGAEFVSILYTKNKISDKTYLVFSKNGEQISEKGINMLSIDYAYNYSVENLVQINIK